MDRLSFLFACCLIFTSITAQRIAEFQLDDEKAIQIGEEELQMLLEKEWYLNKFEYQEKKGAEVVSMRTDQGVKFRKDYTYETSYGTGKWDLHTEHTLIQLNGINDMISKNTYVLSGFYAIWEISDTSLILAKVLTSKQDQAMVYHFNNKPSNQYILVKDAEYFKRREIYKKEAQNQKDALEFEELLVEGKKIKVRKLEQQDLFMRNIRSEKGFAYYHTESGKLIKIAAKEE